MTQKELAQLCGISESTVSAAEVGRRGTRLQTILRICKGLNIHPEQLTQETEKLEEASGSKTRAATFMELLENHQESEKKLWLFVFECLESRLGRQEFFLGEVYSATPGKQAGKPRARGKSRRKS